jgi:hypothetical protein
MLAASTEYPSDMLPVRSPAVIVRRRVPRAPCPTRHRTDVSDTQPVPSHPVCPTRPIAVKATTPRLDPCTVTDADPVPAWFKRRVTLRLPASTEYTSDMLPTRSPAVTVKRRVPREPCPTRHRTDVSDSQPVPSHPVCPDLTIPVKLTRPRPAPCTVTDADPVPARLLRRDTLTLPASNDVN